ncbi:MAG TPA: hypothetical protein VMZ30_06860 [Pyrinomonadaceae bacterium]|nr:hypothetical protein [Pyrinomonadaceae bacterium]
MNTQRTKNAVWSWEVMAAVCCFGGGIGAALLGSVLTASTWILGAEMHPWVRGLGTALLILTIPLLILAGYCMDWAEREPEKPRLPSSENGERGSVPVYQALVVGVFLTTVLIAPLELHAQQTVFNVPTTDVLDKGKLYFEMDISAKPNDSAALDKFSSFVPRLVVGAGNRVEVGLNVLGNVQPGPDATTIAPAVKWKVYDGGWAIALGDNVLIPVCNKSYDLGTYAYSMVQKTVNKSTRVGFGGYFYSKNVVAPNANRAGGQFTFEQPVTKKLNINADWYTGNHANGYLTTGTAYKLTTKLTGLASYSIGNANAPNGNHFLYFELGYNFN